MHPWNGTQVLEELFSPLQLSVQTEQSTSAQMITNFMLLIQMEVRNGHS